jgi:hypothetical protein
MSGPDVCSYSGPGFKLRLQRLRERSHQSVAGPNGRGDAIPGNGRNVPAVPEDFPGPPTGEKNLNLSGPFGKKRGMFDKI